MSQQSVASSNHPSCPRCGNVQRRLGDYLAPWSSVMCQRCGSFSPAEQWFGMDEVLTPFEQLSIWETTKAAS
jgi:hypothetical protein